MTDPIHFECEVLEVKAKKDGIDRMYRIVLQTSEQEAIKLQEYIAQDSVVVVVTEVKK